MTTTPTDTKTSTSDRLEDLLNPVFIPSNKGLQILMTDYFTTELEKSLQNPQYRISQFDNDFTELQLGVLHLANAHLSGYNAHLQSAVKGLSIQLGDESMRDGFGVNKRYILSPQFYIEHHDQDARKKEVNSNDTGTIMNECEKPVQVQIFDVFHDDISKNPEQGKFVLFSDAAKFADQYLKELPIGNPHEGTWDKTTANILKSLVKKKRELTYYVEPIGKKDTYYGVRSTFTLYRPGSRRKARVPLVEVQANSVDGRFMKYHFPNQEFEF